MSDTLTKCCSSELPLAPKLIFTGTGPPAADELSSSDSVEEVRIFLIKSDILTLEFEPIKSLNELDESSSVC